MFKIYYLQIISLSTLILILHVLALKLSLYWITDWFDILMHFLGGFLITFIIFVFFKRLGLMRYVQNIFLQILIVISLMMIVGLIWELWEIFVGFTDTLRDFTDTVVDLIMDFLGGLAACFYLIINRKN